MCEERVFDEAVGDALDANGDEDVALDVDGDEERVGDEVGLGVEVGAGAAVDGP